jgi:GT2 family glycosyltransferase
MLMNDYNKMTQYLTGAIYNKNNIDISVVVVTYNSAICVDKCLNSALVQKDCSYEIIIVDNASEDETVSIVGKYPVKLLACDENLGFGRGCNLGFSHSTGNLIYFLNPDAWLESEVGFARICRAFSQHLQWGMAGTRVLNTKSGRESLPSKVYPGQTGEQKELTRLPGDIAWVIGASMIIRRDVFEKLNGFDGDYFLYGEETDLCLRLRKQGYEIGHITEVTAYHIGGASEDSIDPYKTAEKKARGMILFRKKHYSYELCLKLAIKDLKYSRIGAVLHGFMSLFQPKHSRAWKKKCKCSAIVKVSKEYLLGENIKKTNP